jgi:hypothetical protein
MVHFRDNAENLKLQVGMFQIMQKSWPGTIGLHSAQHGGLIINHHRKANRKRTRGKRIQNHTNQMWNQGELEAIRRLLCLQTIIFFCLFWKESNNRTTSQPEDTFKLSISRPVWRSPSMIGTVGCVNTSWSRKYRSCYQLIRQRHESSMLLKHQIGIQLVFREGENYDTDLYIVLLNTSVCIV